MKITAERGEGVFLLEIKKRISRVLRLNFLSADILSQEVNTDSVLSRGYWEPFTDSRKEKSRILKVARRLLAKSK